MGAPQSASKNDRSVNPEEVTPITKLYKRTKKQRERLTLFCLLIGKHPKQGVPMLSFRQNYSLIYGRTRFLMAVRRRYMLPLSCGWTR